jgi:hypothetical protein
MFDPRHIKDVTVELSLQPIATKSNVVFMTGSADVIDVVFLRCPGKRFNDVVSQNFADGTTGIVGIESTVHLSSERDFFFPVANDRISQATPS